MQTITYTTRPGTRHHRTRTNESYAVREVLVNGEVVGALHRHHGHLFAEVQWPDGTRKPQGDCTLDSSRADDYAVERIMATRAAGPDFDWRKVGESYGEFTARRAGD